MIGLDSMSIAFLVGLLAGWGFLPRPAWVEPYLAWAMDKAKAVFALWGKTPPPPPSDTPPPPAANSTANTA